MLKIFNSLTRQVEEFKPIADPKVTMYTCGPTVYQFSHIGNFRAFQTSDLLVRILKTNNYDPNFVMNITDVGHLTNDEAGGGDTGEDKIEKTALKENKTTQEVAEFYTEAFQRDYEKLNMTMPSKLVKATEHIIEQIELIERLQSKGYTYIINDGVYFDTSKFKKYGELSSMDKIKEGARVEINTDKRNARDFALWKFSPATETGLKRSMEWDSPWGVGFPGWHLECSAMSLKYLTGAYDSKGRLIIDSKKNYTIDIHTGGVDHKEIHHPNEIAQSEAATGKKFVNYWIHTSFMLVAGQKMSKSLGNIYTIYDLEKQNYDPFALRYLYLQTHYRQEMNFTFPALESASNALKKLKREMVSFGEPIGSLPQYEERFIEAVNNDLNTPEALAILWELVKSDNPPGAKASSIFKMDEILGLNLREGSAALATEKQIVPAEVQKLLKERKRLRSERRFSDSDRIRKQINDLGYEIEDTEKGTKVRKIAQNAKIKDQKQV